MTFKKAPILALLVCLSQSVLGLVDVTEQLYGRTIYAQYSYTGFSNTWIGPFGDSDIYFVEYDGYLREVMESDIFDPANKVRLHVQDCSNGAGFACLMTRWREEQGYRWYLQADWLDVDFETTSTPGSASEFHWQILCTDTTYQVCYFGNRYYEDSYGFARIYGTNTYTLKTDWVTDNPVYWYQFRIVVPSAASQGLVRRDQTVCNTGSMPIATTISIRQGTGLSAGNSWQLTDSVLDEVRSGFKAGLVDSSLGDATSWSQELAGGLAFMEMRETSMNVTVRPGTLVYLVQLTGSYGPYVVRGTNVIIREETC